MKVEEKAKLLEDEERIPTEIASTKDNNQQILETISQKEVQFWRITLIGRWSERKNKFDASFIKLANRGSPPYN